MSILALIRGISDVVAHSTVRRGGAKYPTADGKIKPPAAARSGGGRVQVGQAHCTRCNCVRQPANSHNRLERHDCAHLAHVRVMIRDDDLRVRLGRVRDEGRGSARRAKPFIARALAAAEKAGGLQRRSGRRTRSGAFGRGRAASIAAARPMTNRTRSVAIKARVIRHRARGAPLGTHLAYLRREGVTKDGAPGRMFDAATMPTTAPLPVAAKAIGITSGSSCPGRAQSNSQISGRLRAT